MIWHLIKLKTYSNSSTKLTLTEKPIILKPYKNSTKSYPRLNSRTHYSRPKIPPILPSATPKSLNPFTPSRPAHLSLPAAVVNSHQRHPIKKERGERAREEKKKKRRERERRKRLTGDGLGADGGAGRHGGSASRDGCGGSDATRPPQCMREQRRKRGK